MGCAWNLFRPNLTGIGSSRKSRNPSRTYSPAEKSRALRSAATMIANGFFTIRRKGGPAVGAAARAAETVNAFAAPVPRNQNSGNFSSSRSSTLQLCETSALASVNFACCASATGIHHGFVCCGEMRRAWRWSPPGHAAFLHRASACTGGELR